MKKIKKITAFILAAVLIFTLTSCNSNSSSSSEAIKADEVTAPFNSRADETLVPETGIGTKTLVAYFSATGNTKSVAEKIAAIIGADLYEITPAEPYSDDDLNYNDENSRASKEQKDKNVRPEIAGEELNISDYAIIYLGYPIWFGQAPRIMNTFIESQSLENRIIFPFCTSASSGIGESANDLKSSAKTGNWMDGMRFSSDATEEQIQSWINGSNL